MNKFANGKLYKIVPTIEHLEHEIYIGSTIRELRDRMNSHRSEYTQWKNGKRRKIMIYDLFEKYGLNNFNIELLEDYNCENNSQLREREYHYQCLYKCINKLKAYSTLEEQKQHKKNYELKHKGERNDYHNNWQKNQPTIICDCGSHIKKTKIKRHLKTQKHINLILCNIIDDATTEANN